MIDSTTSPLLVSTDPVLVEFAEDVGTSEPVAVAGGRTRWELGGALGPGTRIVTAPSGIVDYQPEEMTVRVRAGTSVAELHDELAAKGQRTGLPERGGTIGGALVVGENDYRCLGRGRIRETLLQVRYVSAEGLMVNSGGPTVKNVSGFDLPRLMVGSLGTLGLIAEVILRTNPIPAVSRWFCAAGADPGAVGEALLAPSAVLADGQQTWVELEGHGADVDEQAARLRTVGSFEVVDGPPSFPPHRWSLTPGQALEVDDAMLGDHVTIVGVGLVFASEPQPRRSIEPNIAIVSDRIKSNFDPTGRLNPGRNPAQK